MMPGSPEQSAGRRNSHRMTYGPEQVQIGMVVRVDIGRPHINSQSFSQPDGPVCFMAPDTNGAFCFSSKNARPVLFKPGTQDMVYAQGSGGWFDKMRQGGGEDYRKVAFAAVFPDDGNHAV